jgi:glycosyltransferase involved in cell wall biosynthesis
LKSKTTSRKTVIVLDPRGVILSGGLDVMKRHEIYSRSLDLFENDLKFVVISSGEKPASTAVEEINLEFYSISNPTLNFFRFAFKSKGLISRMNLDVKLLIVGDCWESYWSAFILNKFLNRDIPIQIQVHGDIADPGWRRINLKNRVRYSLAKFSLSKVTSVRAVTRYQAENLVNAFGIGKEKIVVVPVPINVIGKLVALKSERPKTIGLIGRIHQDRGIWDFLQLIRVLNSCSKDFKVIVVGDGPSKDKFLLKLESVIPKNRITYLGQLPESELRKAWKRIGVLVSMAPVESYGRVIRESLIAGVPVWATESAGVKDLMDNCKKGEVKLLDLSTSDASLDKDFRSLLKTKVNSEFSKRFIKENNTYAAKLAKSWINTINKAK